MHNYKKGLLCIMVLSAMSLMAAEDKTIKVTTFADENGENSNACSLREAIITAKKNIGYGGCTAGNTLNGVADKIQLEAGTYKLSSELVPESALVISGVSRFNYDEKDKLTQKYPAFEQIKTIISGENRSRIFNTSISETSLTLNDIQLEKGYAENGRGGALLLGGALSFNKGAILNSKADIAGGAIYNIAQDIEKEVKISNSLIQGNQANKGSVIAMDCYGNLGDTKPAVTIAQSSIIQNGSIASASALDFCGVAKVNLSANTIAQNIANSSSGSILRAVSDGLDRFSPYSTLTAISNTIVENSAYSTFLYDQSGSKVFAFNILAFNNSDKSCRYNSVNGVPSEKMIFVASNNALNLASGTDQCVLPKITLESTVESSKNLDVSSTGFSSLLSKMTESSAYNMFLPLYYPRDNQSAADLIDVNRSGCSDYDQRGLSRFLDTVLQLEPSKKNSCDIGSVERMNLSAIDITDLKNSSIISLLEFYQSNIDELKALIDEGVKNSTGINDFKEELAQYENLLKYTKQHQKYRAIYFDPFVLAIPAEEQVSDTSGEDYRIKSLNADNYTVEVEPYGIGTLTVTDGNAVLKGELDDLKCEWNADFKQIMIYRTSGELLNTADYAYCKYTLKEKGGEAKQSSGILQASFVNITPVAKDDIYSISSSSNLEVTVNPLENDHDNGDGLTSTVAAAKPAFYQNKQGQEIPIQIEKLPAGLTMTAERQGPCPGTDASNICYGGKLHFAVKNNLSQFDYPVTYKIYDAEGLGSNTATIYLNNTVQNTNSSSSGGGAFGVYGVFAILGLTLYRRYRMK